MYNKSEINPETHKPWTSTEKYCKGVNSSTRVITKRYKNFCIEQDQLEKKKKQEKEAKE